MNLRPGFKEIISGWMIVDDFDDLTNRIERAAEWTKANGPLNADEEATIRFMIESQVARGIRRGDFEPYYIWISGGRSSDEADDGEMPDLGSCCICARDDVRITTIVMLNVKNQIPGHGWGCLVCNLPADGASAVLCESCAVGFAREEVELQFACRGYPAHDGRVPIGELTMPHMHDPGVDHDLA